MVAEKEEMSMERLGSRSGMPPWTAFLKVGAKKQSEKKGE